MTTEQVDTLLTELRAIKDAAAGQADVHVLAKAVADAINAAPAGPDPAAIKAAEDEAEKAEKARIDAGRQKTIADVVSHKAANDAERELQELHDQAAVAMMLHHTRSMQTGKRFNPTELKSVKALNERAKALNIATDGSGQDFVPTDFSTRLVEEYESDKEFATLFEQVTMTRSPLQWHVDTGMDMPYLTGESGNDTGEKIATRTPGTRNVTFTGRKLAVRVLWSAEFDEDSAIEAAGFVRNKIARSLRKGLASALLNGDLTTTHHDTIVTATNDHRRWCDGLFELSTRPATDTIADWGNANTEAKFREQRALMGEYGVIANELIYVVSPGAYLGMMDATDWPNYASLEKVGPRAVNVTGEVGAVDGVPVIVSAQQPIQCDADGVWDGSGSFTRTVIANTRCFALATQRGITVNSAFDIETEQFVLVGSMRGAFEAWYDPTTETAVAGGKEVKNS